MMAGSSLPSVAAPGFVRRVSVQGTWEREPFGTKGGGSPGRTAEERNGDDLREGDSDIGEKMEGAAAHLEELSSWKVLHV